MRYDFIIGNPPYSSKNNPVLWQTFVKKSLSMADKIIMILPIKDDVKIIQEHKYKELPDCSEFFDVYTKTKPYFLTTWKQRDVSKTPIPKQYEVVSGLGGSEIYKLSSLSLQPQNAPTEIIGLLCGKGARYQVLSEGLYKKLSHSPKGKKMLRNDFLVIGTTTKSTGEINWHIDKGKLVGQNTVVFGPNLYKLKDYFIKNKSLMKELAPGLNRTNATVIKKMIIKYESDSK